MTTYARYCHFLLNSAKPPRMAGGSRPFPGGSMASSATRRKPVRGWAAERRARTLMRDAEGDAKRLTIRILEGGKGKPPVAVEQAARKRRRKQTAAETKRVVMASVAPVGLKANVTPQLREAAPVFGAVLRSVTHGFAVVQAALDDTALESLT